VDTTSSFHLVKYLPNLGDAFAITSPQDELYNCIAWAAGDTNRWWWPDEDSFWPTSMERVHSLEAFLEAFRSLGYEVCSDGSYVSAFEKVAIYGDSSGPLHAARQLEDGAWTSKLGPYEDIRHDHLDGVTCQTYGKPMAFLQRPWS
jgi:hypothetical protein